MIKKNKIFTAICSAVIIVIMMVSTVAAASGNLKKNDSGSEVRALQQQLVAKGYMTSSEVDGKFGARTERAVKDFQKYNGLKITGVVDSSTYKKLFGTKASSSDSTLTSSLRKGDSNATVTKVQQKLIALGYLSESSATGYYGSLTYQAISKFQKDNGLTVDGICGKNTYNQLFSSTKKNTSTSVSNSTASFGTLRKGDQNSNVVQVQKKLIAKGYMQGDATGYYGDITYNAIKKFQRAKGLTVDGVCGPKTRNALFGSSTTTVSYSSLASASKMQLGSSGNNVKMLQSALYDKGYFTHDVTGYYGEVTRAAVIKFQRANNLYADGIAGTKTLQAIAGKKTTSSSTVDVSNVTFSSQEEKDIYWLARLIYAESNSEPYTGKVAVGSVVMNRVKKHGKSVYNIIFANKNGVYQFTPAKTGTIYNSPTKDCIKAAKEAYLGSKPVGTSALYFINAERNPRSWVVKNCTFLKKIGTHSFYK